MTTALNRTMNRRRAVGLGLGVAAALGSRGPAGAREAFEPAAIRSYAIDRLDGVGEATSRLRSVAEAYAGHIRRSAADYEMAWERDGLELLALVRRAKAHWVTANDEYEQAEALLVGEPSLARRHALIDASASFAENPDQALDWMLTLPDGRTLERPGNLFHHLTEPALWGSVDSFVGFPADRGGDVLPEADVLLASTTALDVAVRSARVELDGWNPGVQSAFTSLTTMVPTLADFFEQWKRSAFVAGEAGALSSFVAVSRLKDAAGMLNGLDVIYRAVAPAVEVASRTADTEIGRQLVDLTSYVTSIVAQESAGTVFTALEADVLGREAQRMATDLGHQLNEVAIRLDVAVAAS